MNTKLEQTKTWYTNAVRNALIMHHRATDNEADCAISAYHLKVRLDRYPEAQLHYDVDDIADEIVSLGLLAAPSNN